MNAFRNPFLLVILFCSLFLVKCSCEDEVDTTIIEEISQSWRIQSLTVDGQEVTDGVDDFVLTLNRDGQEPTTYSITTGGLVFNFAPSTSGNWSVNDVDNPTQITFGTTTVTLVNASETQLTIEYTAPEEQDKNTPRVRFVLVPRA